MLEGKESSMPLVVENETECRLGDAGLDVLDGDTDADKVGGEPGGVRRGVLVCDANKRPGDIRGLETVSIRKTQLNKLLLMSQAISFSNDLYLP